jgi:hypothetical protein
MPSRPAVFNPRTPGRQAEQRLSSRARGYSAAWDKASKAYRHFNPVCQYGEAGALGEEHTAAATRVDHLYPQRRFPGVFWIAELWVSSCDECDALKQALEHGPVAGLDALARRLGRKTLSELERDRGGSET